MKSLFAPPALRGLKRLGYYIGFNATLTAPHGFINKIIKSPLNIKPYQVRSSCQVMYCSWSYTDVPVFSPFAIPL